MKKPMDKEINDFFNFTMTAEDFKFMNENMVLIAKKPGESVPIVFLLEETKKAK